MQIRCTNCGSHVPVADTGVLPPSCPHCQQRPVPDQLGRFRVVRLLAAGGMGEVYLGEHCELATRVALKLLPVPNGVDAAVVRERFRREAKLAAAIDHPGVVQVLDLAEDRGRMYLVLELVDGTSLRSRLRHGALPAAEAVRIAAAAAEVLGRAHAHGVVHRDVKPENVMLCRDGRVRVLDFGIARALQDQEPLTRTGEILGTPEYMAPEQLLESSEAVDARTDVHALAVLTWELLTGRSPFAGTSMFQALKLVESLVPPPPSRVGAAVPAAVDAVVLRGLSKDRIERFADGAEFAAALRAALPGAAGAGAAPVGIPARAPRRRRLWPVWLLGSVLLGGTRW
jgi:serine/threonine-protein kinase